MEKYGLKSLQKNRIGKSTKKAFLGNTHYNYKNINRKFLF